MLEELFGYITKGVVWHHWRATLGDDCFVAVHLPKRGAEQQQFIAMLRQRGAARVRENLGNGTFEYMGIQGTDNPRVSIWGFSIYGGVGISGGLHSKEIITRIYALTGPARIKAQADRRIRAGTFVVHPLAR
jgi:hypothetical protein